jgi:N-acetylneuraminate synthase
LDNTTAITSVALGSCIIEKHFTLDRQGGGPDDSFSLEPADLKTLCKDAHTAWFAMGQVDYNRKASEQANVQFRRSLYFVKNLKAGDVVQASDVRSVRPGFGLAPKHLTDVVGRTLKMDIPMHSPVQWSCFSSR